MEPSIYTLMDSLEENHWWFAARRAIAENIIRQLRLQPDASRHGSPLAQRSSSDDFRRVTSKTSLE